MQFVYQVGDTVTLCLRGFDLEEWLIHGKVAEVVPGNPPGACETTLPTERASLRLEGDTRFFRESSIIAWEPAVSSGHSHGGLQEYVHEPLPLTA
jgi:hypothetical protein